MAAGAALGVKAETAPPDASPPIVKTGSNTNSAKHLAPNWMMKTTQGKNVELYDELEAGNTVVMVFWASWCQFCHKLLPAIQENSQSVGKLAEQVKVYTLNIWENADPEMYFKREGLNLPMIIEADSLARRYKVRATPGVIVVAPDKSMQRIKRRGRSTERLLKKIRAAVGDDLL